jgi:3-oxoacyl-[acyl-carrier protein] reductase
VTISFDYAGQVVLVTGAATGLGFAIAEGFGKAGATVALNDLSPERVSSATESLERMGITCGGFPADVRDGMAVRTMVDAVVARFGAPDVTVVNAGIYPNTPFLEIAGDEWQRVIDTNLTGAFLTCQAAALAMVAARKHGQIVTIASGAANTAFRGWAHYSASKAALVMLSRSMALELGEHGIRANSVLPGYVDVPEGGEHLDDVYKRDARLASPLGRPGTPEDVANAVLLLASPLAGYVSGATVSVDGGAGAGRKGVVPRR